MNTGHPSIEGQLQGGMDQAHTTTPRLVLTPRGWGCALSLEGEESSSLVETLLPLKDSFPGGRVWSQVSPGQWFHAAGWKSSGTPVAEDRKSR